MENLFFESWASLARTAITTVMSYVLLILLLRVSGKRTLSKMNAFDLIVTIALGSTLATVILSKDVVLADGVLAFGGLIGMQYLISWLAVRSQRISGLIKSTPTLMVYQGRYLEGQMLKERITRDEVLAVIREKGMDAVENAGAVILETDGTLTVIGKLPSLDSSAVRDIKVPDGLGS